MDNRKTRPPKLWNSTIRANTDPPNAITDAINSSKSPAPRATRTLLTTAAVGDPAERRARRVKRSGNEHGEKKAAKPVPAAKTMTPLAVELAKPTNEAKPTYPAIPATSAPMAAANNRNKVRR